MDLETVEPLHRYTYSIVSRDAQGNLTTAPPHTFVFDDFREDTRSSYSTHVSGNGRLVHDRDGERIEMIGAPNSVVSLAAPFGQRSTKGEISLTLLIGAAHAPNAPIRLILRESEDTYYQLKIRSAPENERWLLLDKVINGVTTARITHATSGLEPGSHQITLGFRERGFGITLKGSTQELGVVDRDSRPVRVAAFQIEAGGRSAGIDNLMIELE